MLWNRDQLPESLRDKKPEEIEAAMKKLAELEARSKEEETGRAEREQKQKEQMEEFNKMKERLEEYDRTAAQQQAQPYMQPQQQQQAQPQENTIWNDPDAYIQQKIYPLQLGLLANAASNAKFAFERSLSPRDQKIYAKYKTEVERAMQGYDWAKQADANSWQTALTYVRGLHDQDIAKAESSDSPFFSEPASRGGPEPSEPGENEKLTPDEEEVCRRFHWDPEGYLKRKKEMSLHQSEKGAFARFAVPERSRA